MLQPSTGRVDPPDPGSPVEPTLHSPQPGVDGPGLFPPVQERPDGMAAEITITDGSLELLNLPPVHPRGSSAERRLDRPVRRGFC